jgi:hypothetical protein
VPLIPLLQRPPSILRCAVRVGCVPERLSICPLSSAASLHLPPSLSLLLYQATAACPNCNCTLLALRPRSHLRDTTCAPILATHTPEQLCIASTAPISDFQVPTFDSECVLDRHQLPPQLSNTAGSTPCPFSSERRASHRRARSRLRLGRYHRRMVRDPHPQPSMEEAVAKSRRIVWGLKIRRRRLVRA